MFTVPPEKKYLIPEGCTVIGEITETAGLNLQFPDGTPQNVAADGYRTYFNHAFSGPCRRLNLLSPVTDALMKRHDMRNYQPPATPTASGKNPLHFIAFGFAAVLAACCTGTFGTLMAVPFYLARSAGCAHVSLNTQLFSPCCHLVMRASVA